MRVFGVDFIFWKRMGKWSSKKLQYRKLEDLKWKIFQGIKLKLAVEWGCKNSFWNFYGATFSFSSNRAHTYKGMKNVVVNSHKKNENFVQCYSSMH